MNEIVLSTQETTTREIELTALVDCDDFEVLGIEFFVDEGQREGIDWSLSANESGGRLRLDLTAGAAYVLLRHGRSRYQVNSVVTAIVDESNAIRKLRLDDSALDRHA